MKDRFQMGRSQAGWALFLGIAVAAGVTLAAIMLIPFAGGGGKGAQASGSVSLYARCFRQEPNAEWLGGNCKGYQEGDWVPERLEIDNGTDADVVVDPSVALTLSMDYFDSQANAIGFDDIKNIVFGSCEQVPSADFNNWTPAGAAISFAPVGWTPPGTGLTNPPATQAFTFPTSGSFTVPSGQRLCVYWQAHMSVTGFWNMQTPPRDGSAFWSGASLHVHIDMPNVGNQDVPIDVPEAPATATPTFTPTATETFTPTPTPTNTFTPSPTPTNTFTPSPTPTNTFTPTPTPTKTSTPSPTPTSTNTFTPTPTSTNTFTPTPTSTNTFTPTPTSTNTFTPTPTSTNTFTPTPTNTSTATPTDTPTATPTERRRTSTPTKTPTATATVAPTISPPTPTPVSQVLTEVKLPPTGSGGGASSGAAVAATLSSLAGIILLLCGLRMARRRERIE
jgi:hypothetical protein